MNKNGYKVNVSRKKYEYHSNNLGKQKQDSSTFQSQLNNLEDEQDFLSPILNQEQTGRIIHQSTEHSFDDMGNRVVTTKMN